MNVPDHSDGRMVETGHRKIFFRNISARKDGPAIFFLHGIMDSGITMERLARSFTDRYRVILPDARSHGRSSDVYKGETLHDFVDDIEILRRELKLDRVHLVGHSMGGMMAAMYALRYPHNVQSLIMEDPGFAQNFFYDTFSRLLYGFLLSRSPKELEGNLEKHISRAGRWYKTWSTEEREAWALSQSVFETHEVKHLYRALMGTPRWYEILPKLEVPSLIVTSQKGLISKSLAGKMIRRAPYVKWEYFHGAGHSIRRERYEEYVDVVTRFLGTL